MNNQSKPKSKWSWRLLRWGLISLAVLATLAAVLITEENWRGKHEWKAYQRAAEARGEHLDTSWIVPPPVPDDQNFFAAPVVAEAMRAERRENTVASPQSATNAVDGLKLEMYRGDSARWPDIGGNWQKRTLTDLKPWQTYFREFSQSPEGRTNGFPIAAQPQAPAADVLLALSEFNPAIEALRQAAQRPQARLPLAYEKGLEDIGNLLPWLSIEKRWIRVLQLRTLAELQAGQSQPALEDIKLSLRLADTLRGQPFFISHLVRVAMVAITIQPIYEGIAGQRWNSAQLADLDTALAAEDFLADYQRAMRGERTCALASIETMRATREMTSSAGENGNEIVTNSLRWTPSAFFYQSELAFAEKYDRFILPLANPTNRTISLATYRAGEKDFQTHQFSPYKILERMAFPSVSKAISKFAQAQTHVDLARVVCALERRRLAHGDYPDTLDPLAPELIPSLPHDIVNGQPLHYRRTNDGGYVLYSVGWNESDDGGTVVSDKKGRIDYEKGDWVWQLPAQ
ncbi:MAG: hypothetical protein ABSH48_17565 [Verrucomicrobiota bacterium]|jgi:hypothetical protein